MRKLKNEELNRISVDEFKQIDKTPIVVVLDNIRSLNNIGSVFRTADAFLIEKIYLCGITAQPPHNEIRKTALGATESVDWEYVKDTHEAIEKLKQSNYTCIALEQVENSIMLNDFEPKALQKYAVVFGNEVKGVQQQIVDLCNFSIEIPQLGTKHSLNIAVSAGVVLWDLFSKFKKIR
jgi:tRNA G18 (ribose-2'-O)-methylase SpoU